MTDPKLNILLVDDDTVDVMAVRRALRKVGVDHPVHVAGDGCEALNMLRGAGGCDPLPRPYLILLDLNMPRMNGIEFLKALRADPDHHAAIVFVLTSTNDESQKLEAYDHHVAGYVVKSHRSVDFHRLAEMLEHYRRLVSLP